MATTSPAKPIEKPKPVEPTASQTPNLGPITPEEQALASRIAAGTSEWETIKEEDVLDFSLTEDPFKLPEPAKKLQAEKKFKFRWFTRTPQRADEVRSFAKVRRWWVVNRTQPVGGAFDHVIDPCTGGVHCLDQLLFFKPWWLWEAEQKIEQKLADAQVDELTKKDDTEKNDLKWAAGRRKITDKSRGRVEVHGDDIPMGSEDDIDASLGRRTPSASEADLTTEV